MPVNKDLKDPLKSSIFGSSFSGKCNRINKTKFINSICNVQSLITQIKT